MPKTIELTDIGPVESLTIPVPEDGGVVVLRGANGTGKSSTLKAVERLATGKKDLAVTARDGAPRGELSGCGVVLRVAKSITRTGEIEVESLDGRLSVADLVDPGLKGADEADAKRIRSLVQLAGASPDINIFRPLFDDGTSFDEVVKGKNLETDDILILADRIKRAIDEAARSAEGQANTENAKSAACRESASGINANVETDDNKLQKLLEDAIRHEQDLRSKFEASISRNQQVSSARAKISEAKGTGESLDAVRKRELDLREKVVAAQEMVRQKEQEIERTTARLNGELKELQGALELTDEKWSSAIRELGQAEVFEETIAELNSVVSLGEIVGPTDDELSSAADSVANCRASIEAGVLARRAKEHITKAKNHERQESVFTIKAESLRNSAKRVDDVLSEQIAKLGVPLTVKTGRLVTKTRRGSTLYADLSDGERWKIALDIGIEAVRGDGRGMLVIPQNCWEAPDPDNRMLIKKHLTGSRVVLLTAEATDGPIRAEVE